MLIFGRTKLAKREIYGSKKSIKFWDVDGDNIIISKTIEMMNNPKYLIRYLDGVKDTYLW